MNNTYLKYRNDIFKIAQNTIRDSIIEAVRGVAGDKWANKLDLLFDDGADLMDRPEVQDGINKVKDSVGKGKDAVREAVGDLGNKITELGGTSAQQTATQGSKKIKGRNVMFNLHKKNIIKLFNFLYQVADEDATNEMVTISDAQENLKDEQINFALVLNMGMGAFLKFTNPVTNLPDGSFADQIKAKNIKQRIQNEINEIKKLYDLQKVDMAPRVRPSIDPMSSERVKTEKPKKPKKIKMS